MPAEELTQSSSGKLESDLNRVATFTMQTEKVKALPLGCYSATGMGSVTGQKWSSPEAQP